MSGLGAGLDSFYEYLLKVCQVAHLSSLTTNASRLKMQHDIALDSLYISTENYVINYFRSEGNRTNV